MEDIVDPREIAATQRTNITGRSCVGPTGLGVQLEMNSRGGLKWSLSNVCPGKGDERVGPEEQGTVPRKLIHSYVLAQQRLLREPWSGSSLSGRCRQHRERGG